MLFFGMVTKKIYLYGHCFSLLKEGRKTGKTEMKRADSDLLKCTYGLYEIMRRTNPS